MIPSATGSEGDVKRLELLREAIPGARRLGYLGISEERTRAAELMASAAARLGIELAMHWVDGPAEYASAFAAMRNEGAAGAVVAANQPLASFASRVAASAAEPTADDMRVGLHGPRRLRPRLRPRSYLWTAPRRRIRRPYPQGAAPSELPVERSDAWKLTVNLRAAAQVGLIIPPSLLARADEVIE